MDIMRESKTFDTLLRHWAMLRLIQRWPRKTPTTEIREKLADMGFPEVTLRTIQRDLNKLSAQLPLISDENKPKGWSWEKDATVLDLPAMDPHTALTFQVLSTFSQKLLPPSTLKHMSPHIELSKKVLDNLTKSAQTSWTGKIQTVSNNQPLLPPKIDQEVLDAIYTGLFEEKCFSGLYRTRGKKKYEDWEFNPLGIVFKDSVVYLVATLWNYTDVLQFALHRFKSVEIMEKPCRIPDGFRLADYVNQGEFQYPDEEGEVEFKALFSEGAAIHLHETKLSSDQQLSDVEDGRVLVKATIQMTSQFSWWLLGFGDQVEVLEPKKLRLEITNIAKQMVQVYQ
jgi:predicted DNA-binding transcriptional regulator YafY